MSVTEEVLSDPTVSVSITLVHYDGTETPTRGRYARLPQSEAQLVGAFSTSGPCAWVPTPANASGVSHLIFEGRAWRVLDEEIVGDVHVAWMGASTRYQLVEPQ